MIRVSVILVLLICATFPILPIEAEELEKKDEKIITFGTPFQFYEYSHIQSGTYIAQLWQYAVKGSLYRMNANNTLEPQLAASLPIYSSDGKDAIVTLLPNLLFSNGEALTADDIVFTYESYLDPIRSPNLNFIFVRFFDNENPVDKINDTSVIFHFKEKFTFNSFYLTFAIQPKSHFEALINKGDYYWHDPTDSISAGPYALYRTNNTYLELVKNPNYHLKSEVEADRIIFKHIWSGFEASESLKKGTIDILDPKYLLPAFWGEDYSNISTIISEQGRTQELGYNYLHPILGTGIGLNTENQLQGAANVRKAISHAIDRISIDQNRVYTSLIPARTMFPSHYYPQNGDFPFKKFSLELSKMFMEQAGFNYSDLGEIDAQGYYESTFFDLEISYPITSDGRFNWIEDIAQNLRKIGISASLEKLTTDDIVEHIYAINTPPIYSEGGYDALLYSISLERYPDPGEYYLSGAYNFHNYDSLEYKSLVASYLSELDEVKRKLIFLDLEKYMFDNEIATPIFHTSNVFHINHNLTQFNGDMFMGYTPEWHKMRMKQWPKEIEEMGNSSTITIITIFSVAIILLISYKIWKKKRI